MTGLLFRRRNRLSPFLPLIRVARITATVNALKQRSVTARLRPFDRLAVSCRGVKNVAGAILDDVVVDHRIAGAPSLSCDNVNVRHFNGARRRGSQPNLALSSDREPARAQDVRGSCCCFRIRSAFRMLSRDCSIALRVPAMRWQVPWVTRAIRASPVFWDNLDDVKRSSAIMALPLPHRRERVGLSATWQGRCR